MPDDMKKIPEEKLRKLVQQGVEEVLRFEIEERFTSVKMVLNFCGKHQIVQGLGLRNQKQVKEAVKWMVNQLLWAAYRGR